MLSTCVFEFFSDIPYIAVYDPPEIYERRGCFIPAEPIKATIVSVERDPSETLHLFNPYLYALILNINTTSFFAFGKNYFKVDVSFQIYVGSGARSVQMVDRKTFQRLSTFTQSFGAVSYWSKNVCSTETVVQFEKYIIQSIFDVVAIITARLRRENF